MYDLKSSMKISGNLGQEAPGGYNFIYHISYAVDLLTDRYITQDALSSELAHSMLVVLMILLCRHKEFL